MSNMYKAVIIAGLAIIVVVVLIIKDDAGAPASVVDNQSREVESAVTADDTEPGVMAGTVQTGEVIAGGVPKMLEVGSDTCRPCKMMIPIIDKLTVELNGKLDVEFINVRTDPDAAEPYKVSLIPTQIFIGPDGKEMFRHTGFFPMEDILKKWKEFGYDFSEDIESG